MNKPVTLLPTIENIVTNRQQNFNNSKFNIPNVFQPSNPPIFQKRTKKAPLKQTQFSMTRQSSSHVSQSNRNIETGQSAEEKELANMILRLKTLYSSFHITEEDYKNMARQALKRKQYALQWSKPLVQIPQNNSIRENESVQSTRNLQSPAIQFINQNIQECINESKEEERRSNSEYNPFLKNPKTNDFATQTKESGRNYQIEKETDYTLLSQEGQQLRQRQKILNIVTIPEVITQSVSSDSSEEHCVLQSRYNYSPIAPSETQFNKQPILSTTKVNPPKQQESGFLNKIQQQTNQKIQQQKDKREISLT